MYLKHLSTTELKHLEWEAIETRDKQSLKEIKQEQRRRYVEE